ncbi:Hypothetical Protein FCC1311_058482 [Hondaea fermentalgiana]|uniref:Uncharacterized protein n=1 Tax=Hondaea fermentalgiana TaxID=2315210 RepID=A0A2R5GFG2_9STRA|nr:Hypothetical Protein FCC1311_058482 [Hondaea fermentalgiana]|eukprot:GBG29627.1 Hypothetical Protein FCC1311_058482 [Hondaea fermentalgiana]
MEGHGAAIGNYKGVMLCNRPFGGVSHAAKKAHKASANKQPPFKTSCGISEKIGLNPIRHPPNVVVERSKKDTAFSKHLRFLADLHKQKVSMQEEITREAQEKEQRRAAAREKWRRRREMVVKARKGEDFNPRGASRPPSADEQKRNDDDDNYDFESTSDQAERKTSDENDRRHHETRSQYASSSNQESKTDDTESDGPEPSRRSKKTLQARPKWALTKDAVEELEDYEAEDLLNFAKELDFDSFINDLEVRSALKAAKSRVDRIKRSEEKYEDDVDGNGDDKIDSMFLLHDESKHPEAGSDNGDAMSVTTTELREFLTAGATGALRKSAANIREQWRARREAAEEKAAEWNHSIRADQSDDERADEVASVASGRSILSASSVKSLKQIHSAKSIAKVAESLGVDPNSASLRRIEEIAEADDDDDEMSVVPPPRIVRIHEDGRKRLTKKDETYNLPYMHRNPAI